MLPVHQPRRHGGHPFAAVPPSPQPCTLPHVTEAEALSSPVALTQETHPWFQCPEEGWPTPAVGAEWGASVPHKLAGWAGPGVPW